MVLSLEIRFLWIVSNDKFCPEVLVALDCSLIACPETMRIILLLSLGILLLFHGAAVKKSTGVRRVFSIHPTIHSQHKPSPSVC